ncbi:MAG: T9SS type A sorting domain-containing protein [Saprospiraceae bacterium]|nr:T9SS type A sorting domain-containing protein [Saprospiraceae bacterium]
MMKYLLFISFAFFLITNSIFAQRNCATMEVLDRLQIEYPALQSRMEAIERHTESYLRNGLKQREKIVIPVVVHIVYGSSRENISDAQVQSQIDVLNEDFRAINNDISAVPTAFAGLIGDSELEFCLANTDPSGNPTNGITRKQSSRPTWGTSDRVKRASQGGVDAWNTSQYLNIWVCNIGNGILGYAQFPGGPAATDGVVIDYRYFGRRGSAVIPYNLGRTATHEVGHWLNLRHIWGDSSCGSDGVDDTPTHYRANYGCPIYPHYSECGENIIEMTMNYMDYTEDHCMYMFSRGQSSRMQAAFAPGGPRAALRNSIGCSGEGGNEGGGGGDPDPEPIVCLTATGLNATNVTTNSATLNWIAATNANSYDVRLRPVGSSTWSSGTTTSTSINATELSPNTQYEFQVQTNCSSTESNFSASATFTTQPIVVSDECADNFENNNYKSSAASVPVNTTVKALISVPSDVDWFTFTNTASEPNIQVELSNLTADYDVRLYRGNSQVKISDESGIQDELITYNTSSVTTYYLQIYGYRNAYDRNNCYELKVSLSGNRFRESTPAVSSKEPAFEEAFVVFPNPASEQLMLDIPNTKEALSQIIVYDMTGKIVLQTSKPSEKNVLTSLDIHHLPNGIYIIKIQNGDFTANQKFVISR